MKTQVMVITPEVAEQMLTGNKDNRNIRKMWVKQLSGMMTRGEFILTHQGIAFSASGRLLDGQHRLLAIIDSGETIQMMVTRDADESSFVALDIGAKRSFSDLYGATPDCSGVAAWLGKVMHSQPSPAQKYKIYQVIEPFVNDLMDFCPSKRKGITNSQVVAAAIIRMLNGEDQDYIKLIYANLAHASISELPPIGRCFVDQIFSLISSSHSTNVYDTFARAIQVFDQTKSEARRLVIRSHLESTDFARTILSGYLDEKKPASKAPVSTRAKSTKLSHVKVA